MKFATKLTISYLLILFLTQKSVSRSLKATTASELQSQIDRAQPGDTIELAAADYEGDFVIRNSGSNYSMIKLVGSQAEDGSTATQIIGKETAIYLKANFWFIKDLNVTAKQEGIVIEGNQNHLESLAILEPKQAVIVQGDQNTMGSISISNVGEGIIVQGSSNTFRDIAWSNSSSGIIIEKGDKNKLHNLAIHNNIKEGPALLLSEGTCCGVLTNLVMDGLVEILGNNYYLRNTVGSEAVNIIGCDNTFGRSVYGRTYFTKECNNTLRSSNIFHYPQTKPTLLKDV